MILMMMSMMLKRAVDREDEAWHESLEEQTDGQFSFSRDTNAILSPEKLFFLKMSFCLWTQSHKIICYCPLSLFSCCSFEKIQVLSPLSLYPYLFDEGNILVDFPVADFTVGSVLSFFMFRRCFPFKGFEIVQRRSSSTSPSSSSSFFVLH